MMLNAKYTTMLLNLLPHVLNKHILLGLFTKVDFPKLKKSEVDLTNFKQIIIVDNKLCYVSTSGIIEVDTYKDTGEALFKFTDTLKINNEDIANYNDTKFIETTVGILLVNYTLLVKPFGNKIPYWNKLWDIKNIEKQIAEKVLVDEITITEFNNYLDIGYYIAQFSELCVPSLTAKSSVTHPDVPKRKKELIEKYKDRLNDPIVIKKIENELIALDKEWLKGDDSIDFYDAMGSTYYEVNRKKMHLMIGGVESFDKGSTEYSFIPNSLSEGYDKTTLDVLVNEARNGIYGRGTETQKGGAMSKQILRVFQDLEINKDDCNTKVGLNIILTDEFYTIFEGCYLLDNDKTVLLNDTTKSKYLNKKVIIRSPQYCKNKNGLCKKCVGSLLETLDTKAISIEAMSVSSTFVSASLSKMHGSAIATTTVDFEKYFT